jgi:hypothetical protein
VNNDEGHQFDLQFNEDETVTATCIKGDLSLTDSWALVMLATRDHQLEKQDGILLD